MVILCFFSAQLQHLASIPRAPVVMCLNFQLIQFSSSYKLFKNVDWKALTICLIKKWKPFETKLLNHDIILCQNNCSIFPLVKKHQAAIMRVIFLFQFSTTYTLVKNVDQKAFSIFFIKYFLLPSWPWFLIL